MPIYESGEMYLETIYVLTRDRNDVRSIDVCEHMGYSKPSVSRAVMSSFVNRQLESAFSTAPGKCQSMESEYIRTPRIIPPLA